MFKITVLSVAAAGALMFGLATQAQQASAARVGIYIGVPGVSVHVGKRKTYHCHTNWVKKKGKKKKVKVTYCHTAWH